MKKFIKIITLIIISHFVLIFNTGAEQKKIQIGLLVPMTGADKDLGQSIIKAVRLAIKDIDSDLIEVIPKDTASTPNKTLQSALELKDLGVKIVIGPIFHKNLVYLEEVIELTFLSLTNKTLELPKNVISAGINSTSQLNTIKKFIKENNIKKTIFLSPIQDYEFEIKKGMKDSKIKIFKKYNYNTEPTELTLSLIHI